MAKRPNIVFIMPDQLRPDFLSCYDAAFIDTPHIDALAEQGIIYGRAYSAHPVCVPARCSLMTGMHAIKNGVLDNGQFLRQDLDACGISTWPELLNDAGYHTISTGKMHFYPWEARLGFQERIIAEDKHWPFIQDDYYHFLKARGYVKSMGFDKPAFHEHFMAFVSDLPYDCSVDYFVGAESARWIDAYESDKPFAMMVGFPGPHSPYDPSPEFADLFNPQDMPEPLAEVPEDTATLHGRPIGPSRKSWYAFKNQARPTTDDHMLQRAYYASLVKQIDGAVGMIVDALRRKGELDNTVILFSSDHGDYLGDHNLGGKNSFYESACKVPMLVRYPGLEAPVVSQDLVTLSDVTATILALAGCQVPEYMDSLPLPGLGLGDQRRERVVGMLTRSWMLYDGRWKLCKYAGGGSLLFDLEQDPQEQHNLIAEPAFQDKALSMDVELTETIMRALNDSHFDKRLYTSPSYSGSESFGHVGWTWHYPTPWGETFPDNLER